MVANSMNQNQRKTSYPRGFTLIEMLISLIIFSILTVIAYTSYVNWIVKSNRADAMATLSQDQVILERCYAQTFAYNNACSSLPTFPQTSPQGYYTITLSNLTATTYTLTATATGSQVRDKTCTTMSVDQANQKTAANNASVAQTICWQP
jgi:type IV pilus assembly protein PilE